MRSIVVARRGRISFFQDLVFSFTRGNDLIIYLIRFIIQSFLTSFIDEEFAENVFIVRGLPTQQTDGIPRGSVV